MTKKSLISATLAGALTLTSGFYAVKSGQIAFPVPYYTVARIIDGDTFVTTEKQYIRLSSTYAPELENCLGMESKKALEKLVMGKKVYLKVLYRDAYQRLISLVYTPDGYINEQMITQGMAYYLPKNKEEIAPLQQASQIARDQKIGIYSSLCTQQTNTLNPKCNIKGNVSINGKFYRTPNCGQYNITILQLYLDDRWFCSEKEAEKAGFVKGGDCK